MAITDGPDTQHQRPDGTSDKTVEAVGKVTEALEWVERARGDLYDFHQKMGHADELFAQAADALEQAGHTDQAELLHQKICGRNVLQGRWTFQVIEEFDDNYYSEVRAADQHIRDNLLQGKRHVFEAELKEKTRTKGGPGHEATPGSTI